MILPQRSQRLRRRCLANYGVLINLSQFAQEALTIVLYNLAVIQ